MPQRTDASLPPVVDRNSEQPNRSNENPLFHSRGLILGLLFGVLAILGLPLLWYSPVFSRGEKWFWSLVIVLYTLLLLGITAVAVLFAYRAFSQM